MDTENFTSKPLYTKIFEESYCKQSSEYSCDTCPFPKVFGRCSFHRVLDNKMYLIR